MARANAGDQAVRPSDGDTCYKRRFSFTPEVATAEFEQFRAEPPSTNHGVQDVREADAFTGTQNTPDESSRAAGSPEPMSSVGGQSGSLDELSRTSAGATGAE